MKLNHFAQLAALRTAHSTINAFILEASLSGPEGDQIREKFALKRLQFDTSPELYSKVEGVCSLLDCTKREFLEMAVIDAIDKAWTVFQETYQEVAGHAWGEEDSFLDSQINGAPRQFNDQE
jgi:hypothetical protein